MLVGLEIALAVIGGQRVLESSISSSEALRITSSEVPFQIGLPAVVRLRMSSLKPSQVNRSRAVASSPLMTAIAVPSISSVNIGNILGEG